MAYTFLDRGLNPMGVLTNKGGQTNNYWGDQITHSIATGNDVLTSVSLSIDKETTNIDTSGNQKEWNHTIQGLSFGIDGIGREVNELNYLMYKDGEMGRNYLMTITQVDESLTQSGFHFKTIQGINSAAYDLSRKTLRAKEFGIVATGSVTQGTAQNILGYIFDGLGWDVRTIGSFPSVDYSVQDGATAQSVLQDIIKLFDSSVDAYVLINNLSTGANVFTGGGSVKRVFDFSTDIGRDDGQTIRLNKNLVSLTKTGARDSMYTKLFVSGNDITIGPANNGVDYIVDDDANREYNVLGANSVPVQYLEGAISNSAISDPHALLTWGKKQLAALNHPRFNYVVSSVDGKNVHLGDTVVIQDLKASQPIMLKSKIISKTLSFADPQTDSFVVGEFSPIVITSRNGNTDDIIQMVNKANQVASEANKKAEEANTVASSAADKADKANSKAESVFDEAKDYADNLSKNNNELVNSLSSDLQSKSDSLYASQQTIASQATAYTDSAVADANVKAVQIGQSAAQNAQSALDAAKKDLTSSFASQASQTASMASEAKSKASQYADQAKSDAIAVATSADGVVRTEFKSTTDSMTATIQKNKSDAEGKISTAQTTATQALNGLATKVSQTEYNTKTGQLQTDLTATTQTANQAKTDIVSIKQKDGEQDEKMNSIVSDVNGTKQTVSDLQTVQGKQSGDISTLQQRANGFDATVTKVNNLAVGGRNLLTNTNKDVSITSHTTDGWPAWANIDTGFSFENGKTYTFSAEAKNSTDKIAEASIRVFEASTNTQVGIYAFPADGKRHSVTFTIPNDSHNYHLLFYAGHAGIAPGVDLTTTYHHPKLEAGNIATDWTPAPEDIDSNIAQVKLTADGVYQTVNNPQTGLNTRVSTAEGNINTIKSNVDGMSNTVTQTSNGLTQEISDRQTGDSNTLQAGKDFTTSQIKNYDTGMQSQIGQMSDGILATVATTNLIIDSSLISQLDNWRVGNGSGKWYYSGLASYKSVSSIGFNSTGNLGAYNSILSQPIDVNSFSGNVLYTSIDLRLQSIGGTSTDYLIVYLLEEDATGKVTKYNNITGTLRSVVSNWTNYRSKITVDSTTKKVYLSYQFRGDGNAYVSRPYVGTTELPAGGYTPGATNNNTTVLSLLKDNWSIGIADNSGALISGINGDKSGTVISGDKIVLDGKVTVTDDFNASKIITRGLATTNATIEKTLTMGSYGKITASYDKNGYFPTATNLNVQYILNGGYTFTRDGILLSGESRRNSEINSSPVIGVGNTGYILDTWNSNLSIAESNIKISATNTKGYVVNTSVSSSLTNVPDATIDINPYFITMKAESSQTTISSTGITSNSINASKSLWSGGDANISGSLNVTGSISSNTDSVFNKSLKANGYLESGQDIKLGWSLTKNGVGIFPSKFNGLPGIHINGTGAGIVFDSDAGFIYGIAGNKWYRLASSASGTGSWLN